MRYNFKNKKWTENNKYTFRRNFFILWKTFLLLSLKFVWGYVQMYLENTFQHLYVVYDFNSGEQSVFFGFKLDFIWCLFWNGYKDNKNHKNIQEILTAEECRCTRTWCHKLSSNRTLSGSIAVSNSPVPSATVNEILPSFKARFM